MTLSTAWHVPVAGFVVTDIWFSGRRGRQPATTQRPRERRRSDSAVTAESGSNPRLALLLAAAMFVLVVDTSFMNVSISAVVKDLHTTASGVQSAIALEALVSAAFILINSKMGDLIGRKRAYVIGLLAYAIGALAMTLTQSLTRVIIFWAIIGGLGPRSCCRPCSRSFMATSRGPPRRRPTPSSGPPQPSLPPSARSSAVSSPPTCRGASDSASRSSSSSWCCPRSAS